MSARLLLAPLALALFIAWAAPAHASRAHDAWLQEFERAGDDDAKLTALVEAQPALSRVWFYAYVFDLATPGIPDPEKDRIRRRAAVMARVFAAAGDDEPQVLLDSERSGRLATLAAAVRAGVDVASQPASVGIERALPLAFDSSTVVRGVFYGLLHRAHVSARAMAGRVRVEELVDAASTLAGGWFHLTGDAAPWRTIEAWYGEAGVPLAALPVVAQAEAQGLALLLAGQPLGAQAAFKTSREIELSQHGPTPRATFLRGALSEALVALGQRPEALAERQAMVAEFAAVKQPWPPVRARARTVEVLAESGDFLPLLPELTAVLAAPAVVQGDPDIARILLRAADALRAEGAASFERDPDWAERLLGAAGETYRLLQESGVLNGTVPAEAREAAATARAAAAARVDVARARLADARGRLDEALALVTNARPALAPADGPAADALIGRLALDLGRLDEALARTAAAEAALTDPVERAQNRVVRARVRLARDEAAPAFAWANEGLRGLRAAGLEDAQRGLRVELHRVAAAALWANGDAAAARARLRFALGVAPSADAALDLAGLEVEAGAPGRAVAAFDAVSRSDPGLIEVVAASGCIHTVLAPKTAPMILNGAVSPDPVVTLRRDVCLARARGDDAAALTALRTRAGAHAEPRALAGLNALAAEVADTPEARQAALRRALVELRRGLADGRPRIEALRPEPAAMIAALRDGLSVDDPAAVSLAFAADDLAARVWRPAPAGPETDAVRAAIAEVQGRVAVLQRLARLGRPDEADVAAAAEALAAARARLDVALEAQAAAHPRWAALVRPALPDAAPAADPGAHRLVYRTGEGAGRLWVWAPGAATPTSHPLPARRTLRRWVDEARAALADPKPWPGQGDADPHEAAWATLARLADGLLPPALRDALDDRPVHIYADGPLVELPFEALVLATPAAPGAAPRFFATDRPVLYRGTSTPVAPAEAPPAGRARVVWSPADEAALVSELGEAAAEIEALAPDAPLDRGVLHSAVTPDPATVPARGPALLILDAAPPPMPLLAWAGVGEVLAPTGLRAGGPDPLAAAALWGHLLARPPASALVFTGGALMPGRVAEAADALPPSEAVRRWRLDAMTRPAVPGVVPTHHPSHWARWRRIVP